MHSSLKCSIVLAPLLHTATGTAFLPELGRARARLRLRLSNKRTRLRIWHGRAWLAVGRSRSGLLAGSRSRSRVARPSSLRRRQDRRIRGCVWTHGEVRRRRRCVVSLCSGCGGRPHPTGAASIPVYVLLGCVCPRCVHDWLQPPAS
ncbi:hypothetical protein OH77DRAFT_755321 [Trametes cingulata]|nr:hypothetical protein OH77DRAFT_755321 [Trametes cingulata]